MLRMTCLILVMLITGCGHAHKKVYVVDNHRYTHPVVVVHKQPAKHLNCWRVKARRWHCYR